MSKARYIPWTPFEEGKLPGWLADNRSLSWQERAEKYCREVGLDRGPESLRGKQNQLLKGISRRRLISASHSSFPRGLRRLARHQQKKRSPAVPAQSLAVRLKRSDSDARQLLRQLRPEETLTTRQQHTCKLSALSKGSCFSDSLDQTVRNKLFVHSGKRRVISTKLWAIFDQIVGTRSLP